MASSEKFQSTVQRLKETQERVYSTSNEWQDFLEYYAKFYKYRYEETMLIYAQRPDATAVATMEIWNKKVGRFVVKGAKGIAILDHSNGQPKLKYLFDVADTVGTEYTKPKPWVFLEEHADAVKSNLATSTGSGTRNVGKNIESIARQICESYFDEIDEKLASEDKDENKDIKEAFVKAVQTSAFYVTARRCNWNIEALGERVYPWPEVKLISELGLQTLLGNAVADTSSKVLKVIEQTVKFVEREKAFQTVERTGEKNVRTEERGQRGTDLHNGDGRDNVSQFGTGTGSGQETVGEIRSTPASIPSGVSEGSIFGAVPVGAAHEPSPLNGGTGDGHAVRPGSQVEETEPGTIVGRLDSAGATLQPDTSSSGGDNLSGSNISGSPKQVTLFELIAGGQDINAVNEVSENADALNVPVGSTIGAAIVKKKPYEPMTPATQSMLAGIEDVAKDERTLRIEASLLRTRSEKILKVFAESDNRNDRASKVKDAYGTGGGSITYPDWRTGWYQYEPKGYTLRISGEDDVKLTWPQVVDHIDRLIKSGLYMENNKGPWSFVVPECFHPYCSPAALHEHTLEKYRRVMIAAGPFTETGKARIYNAVHSTQYTPVIQEIIQDEYSKANGVIKLDENTKGYVRYDESALIMRIGDPENGEEIRNGWFSLTCDIEHSVRWNNQWREEAIAAETGLYERSELSGDTENQISENHSSAMESAADIDADGVHGVHLDADQASDADGVHGVHLDADQASDADGVHGVHLDAEQASDGDGVHGVHLDVESQVSVPAVNYHITAESHIGEGGLKAKFRQNIEAIKLVKQLETESRNATIDEQHILARYVGWGGMPQAFDEKNKDWSTESKEIKELLTEREYIAARESTLNAHYTSPVVIQSMYDVLARAGLKTGNILEPAMGVGNFLGMLPESMQKSRLTGVEIDSLTGRIAKKLYPKADIRIQGFETADIPDNFFDAAISNVPFGNYQLADPLYDKNRFMIHDYFFAKSLDKVRPGGVVAFITSKGTMDKANSSVRKYISQRAELVGAIRLPNTAFKANANTEVTTDILFLKKRERMIETDSDWIHVEKDSSGIPMNQYFLDHPEMILGKMVWDQSMYGNEKETACIPIEGQTLEESLKRAMLHVNFDIAPASDELKDYDDDTKEIPADPDVKNYTFTIVDDKIYFRENSIMRLMDVSEKDGQRIRALHGLRTTLREVISLQLAECTDEQLSAAQAILTTKYDAVIKEYGHFDGRALSKAFGYDADYPLLCSLEKENDGEYEKAAIFTKRTIKPSISLTRVETSAEALAASLNMRGYVDIGYMANLSGKQADEIITELQGVIFQNPEKWNDNRYSGWEPADEYLSGNVRVKLRIAENAAQKNPELFSSNLKALQDVQPQDVPASDIVVRLGASWIPPRDVRDFIIETLTPPEWANRYIKVTYVKSMAQWVIDGKGMEGSSIKNQQVYGTTRMSAYDIIEDSLNLRSVKVYDVDPDNKRILNQKETIAAQEKQDKIKAEFENWIFNDPKRRERLVRKYNEEFNSVRLREFNGDHLVFPGMNPEVKLRKHQVDAVARVVYGGNTLLAHVVGAGKTYEMFAAGMTQKRIGLARKPLYVVPSHLVVQSGAAFLQLYPSANVLVATKADFEKKNRQRFISRIATGDYDAVIIGQSSFEKIPVSKERIENMLQSQIDETVDQIEEMKLAQGQRTTVKILERIKKSLEADLKRLTDSSRKDDVVNFEELGIDLLVVDEADNYKNLFLVTKMGNVAGISTSKAKKSTDLFNKIQYLEEINPDRGVVFATGTPISNSMVEMYTMQKYLQFKSLKNRGLAHFDAWASTFGESVTSLELTPDGNGYRAKTRFAKFYNLPELTSMFKEVADIQTADMLKLEVPRLKDGKPIVIVSEASTELKAYIKNLGDRADRVRRGVVRPEEDNMLKICHDGKMAALDLRCMDSEAIEQPDGKISKAVENIYNIWKETEKDRLTQLVFSDISTPGGNSKFCAYEEVRGKLMHMGVPKDDIAFIHDYNTDNQKEDLFESVRKGKVRILMGSTAKMGAGTNVQDKLIALHHIDVPWRPRDIEQREGRIVRQGNKNEEVAIYRYVTAGSFDAYSWNIIEQKQKFISQIMTGKTAVRNAEDVDSSALSYAEVKALASGNPHVKEKMEVDMEVTKLQMFNSQYRQQKYQLQDFVAMRGPVLIAQEMERINVLKLDLSTKNAGNGTDFVMEISGTNYTKKEDAGKALLTQLTNISTTGEIVKIGSYKGFTLEAERRHFGDDGMRLYLMGHSRRTTDMGQNVLGNIQRIENLYNGLDDAIRLSTEKLSNYQLQVANAEIELQKPFEYAEKLEMLKVRQVELNEMLSIENKVESVLVSDDELEASGNDEPDEDGEDDEVDRRPHRASREYER